MSELPVGYIPEPRMAILEDFVRDNDIHTVLEIGRQEGYGSTRFLVKSGAEVWSVDISDAQFKNRSLLLNPKYHHIVADSISQISQLDGLTFDMVYLDSSHLYNQTKIEIAKYFPITRKWFVVDDYNYTGDFSHSPIDYDWDKLCYKAFCESDLTFSPILATRDYEGIRVGDKIYSGYTKGMVGFYGVRIGGANGPSPFASNWKRCPKCSFVAYEIYPMRTASPRSVMRDQDGYMCPKCYGVWVE